VRLPVFLGRRPEEPVDKELRGFYERLLAAIHSPLFHEGQWILCERTGWPDNPSYQTVVAWTWSKGDDRCLIVVNLSDRPAQAQVRLSWQDLGGSAWRLTDPLSGEDYERSGDDMLSSGLYVDLGPWGYHFFRCSRMKALEKSAATSVGRA